MSTSTAPRFPVRLDSIAGLAAAISEQLLQVRRILLKRRAPKDARVHQIHRNIACGRANPLFALLACSFADLEDGAPLGAVTRPYESAIAALQERFQEKTLRSPVGPGSAHESPTATASSWKPQATRSTRTATPTNS